MFSFWWYCGKKLTTEKQNVKDRAINLRTRLNKSDRVFCRSNDNKKIKASAIKRGRPKLNKRSKTQ